MLDLEFNTQFTASKKMKLKTDTKSLISGRSKTKFNSNSAFSAIKKRPLSDQRSKTHSFKSLVQNKKKDSLNSLSLKNKRNDNSTKYVKLLC